MNRKLIILAVATFAVLVCGCQNKQPSSQLNSVKLQQQWFANSGFAGEIWGMNNFAKKYGLDLQVLPGSDQIDTKQVVKLGAADFGVAGAEQILQANEKGANLVVIGVINPKSLACFISMKPKGILKAKDMTGHKIGTMEGSPVDLVYQALKKKEGLDIPKSAEVPTGWVMTGFTRGDYDVYPAFINDEPIKLHRQGTDVNIIKPTDYGVDFIGTVYFCKKELVDNSPETVQAFVNTMADGWRAAVKDPKQAITYLKAYDKNIDAGKELDSLVASADYYKGEDGKVLYCGQATWEKMASLLTDIGALKKPFDFAACVDNRFVDTYNANAAKGN